ncbi:MAG: flagellar protein export ATPase FliI [Halothiobacillus sp. 14-56-357]|jgi:flagellum-specific ATP synthase|uniref:flagellar protein export ATPase FliI n=1 Tax=Halothiobacillus sp. 15-55-196 TaxID=1970382 RepID=UPI000BDCED70|nr:flagellar protein export ATPase FliI [Halothiobacillus sp. 15-55-196]OZB37642.1 MAG: flagellar protein export ATPase FliI [Halothiobacillus sp. 15-55-196]OZB57346.1 MAG: flagellar protein export ATPase FliI [Halothiobacillus sp. 14-56-357]OZB79448.1 MAG: flagellar protein export ATPase FliI [Halothiobacillus sp. 13-55-115]
MTSGRNPAVFDPPSMRGGGAGLDWARHLMGLQARVQRPPLQAEGRIVRVVGLALEASGLTAAIGDQCRIFLDDDPAGRYVDAEVVGFAERNTYLMPLEALRGIAPGCRVQNQGASIRVPLGPELMGRVLDARGQPLDDGPAIFGDIPVDLQGRSNNPLKRRPIREPLDVGVRAINALLTVGRGQRMGIFAGSGVGKSVLLGMMTRYTAAEIIVVGLIGERGREVREFVAEILDDEARSRAIVIAAPADASPLMRLHGANLATAIAEYFREQGHDVLLLMDSLTRYAQAQREIGLAIGEPPATKGYPPSVFARLPALVERAGNGESARGSMTAFYTVLVEGDDQNDPIADAARAILDGHIVLSRAIAERGRYPAIDIEASISRLMPALVSSEHLDLMQRFKQLMSTYNQSRDLLAVGAYRRGHDVRLDRAIDVQPDLEAFLSQSIHESADLDSSFAALESLMHSAA